MRQRDKKKNQKEIMKAYSMILQIGLSMMVCMAISLGLGYYLDRLFQTKWCILVMLLIGILASLRSMLVLTGVYKPGKDDTGEKKESTTDGDGEDYFD